MKEYSFTEALQNFASILDEARKVGVVCVKKRDGESFYIKPVIPKKSPLDIKEVNLGVSSSEIVDIIREGREERHHF